MAQQLLEVVGNVNYFNNTSGILTLPTAGFKPGQNFSFLLEVLEYTGGDQVGYDVYFRRPLPDEQNCFHWSGITPSGNPTAPLNVTLGPPGTTIEWTGTSGATGCLDFTRVVLVVRNYQATGLSYIHVRFTLTYEPASAGSTYCEYGTEPTDAGKAIVWIDSQYLQLISSFFKAPWIIQYLGSTIGQAITTDLICRDQPPQWQDLSVSDIAGSAAAALHNLEVLAWWLECKCKDGPTTPVPPPIPEPVEPPGNVAAPVITFDPANPCQSLEPVLAMLQQLQRQVAKDYELDSLVQRYQLPMATIAGAVHSNLTGSGSFPISRLVGIQWRVDQLPDNSHTWPGNPTYIKDLGWVSITDQGAMLQERRITRANERWLPSNCALAITFGYYLTPGTVLTVTELEAEP